jgi:hypothetical protein
MPPSEPQSPTPAPSTEPVPVPLTTPAPEFAPIPAATSPSFDTVPSVASVQPVQPFVAPADATPAPAVRVPGAKNQMVALILSILLGTLGVDRFYLGSIGLGVLKLLTGGVFGILWIIDIVLIATKNIKGVTWE